MYLFNRFITKIWFYPKYFYFMKVNWRLYIQDKHCISHFVFMNILTSERIMTWNIFSIFYKIDIVKQFFVITMIKCWKLLFVYWLLYNMCSNLKGVYNLTLFVKPFMSKKGYTFQQCHSKRQVVNAWRIYEIINKAIKHEQPQE